MKFKKFILTGLICVGILGLTGCSDKGNEIDTSIVYESRFCVVSVDSLYCSSTTIVELYTAYDKQTKVMYCIALMIGGNGRGAVSTTLMLDKDGNPLLWEGV